MLSTYSRHKPKLKAMIAYRISILRLFTNNITFFWWIVVEVHACLKHRLKVCNKRDIFQRVFGILSSNILQNVFGYSGKTNYDLVRRQLERWLRYFTKRYLVTRIRNLFQQDKYFAASFILDRNGWYYFSKWNDFQRMDIVM